MQAVETREEPKRATALTGTAVVPKVNDNLWQTLDSEGDGKPKGACVLANEQVDAQQTEAERQSPER